MKLALHGYGNMGRAVEKVATERGHQIVAVMTSSKKAKVSGAEVIIDFSNASGVDDAVALACDNHIDLVIGTTGWNDRLDKLRARVAKDLGSNPRLKLMGFTDRMGDVLAGLSPPGR